MYWYDFVFMFLLLGLLTYGVGVFADICLKHMTGEDRIW